MSNDFVNPVDQYVLVANSSYGLYIGTLVEYDPIGGVAKVKGCRHVCRWYGRTGGITSLAAHGICGPNASQSRIGAPADATLTAVRNVYVCTAEAIATFATSVPQ